MNKLNARACVLTLKKLADKAQHRRLTREELLVFRAALTSMDLEINTLPDATGSIFGWIKGEGK